jgi:membrane-associated protein
MDIILALVDFIIHIDVHLASITSSYGLWAYAILFLIVFAETGLVVAPFLPGDSLLFAAGAICAIGTLDVGLLVLLLIVAAILGDSLNYSIGRRFGDAIVRSRLGRFIRPAYIQRTQAFYERHGGKTIILARFMPIVRTFAPFVAGVGNMHYPRFLLYNVIGGIVWVAGFALLGYWFGNMPAIKKNFSLVILAIIVLSVMPGIVEYVRHRMRRSGGEAR